MNLFNRSGAIASFLLLNYQNFPKQLSYDDFILFIKSIRSDLTTAQINQFISYIDINHDLNIDLLDFVHNIELIETYLLMGQQKTTFFSKNLSQRQIYYKII